MGVAYNSKIVTSNLQMYYDWGNPKCYTGSGSTVNNISTFNNLIDASRNVGYTKNAVTYTGTGARFLTTNGTQSGAVYNVGSRIDMNTSGAGIDRFGAHNFSIMFWVNQTSSGRMMSTGSAGTGTGDSDNCIWQMWCDTGQFFWWNSGGGGTNNITVSGTWHTPGTWQLIGFTYSYNESGNNIVRCYTNGIQQFLGSVPTATHSFIDRSNETIMQWTLGGGYSSSCFNQNAAGNFGSFMLYNRCLTDNEMIQNFQTQRSRFGV
jgi:hypothetical protein